MNKHYDSKNQGKKQSKPNKSKKKKLVKRESVTDGFENNNKSRTKK